MWPIHDQSKPSHKHLQPWIGPQSLFKTDMIITHHWIEWQYRKKEELITVTVARGGVKERGVLRVWGKVPNWKEGEGGESSWSHMFLPFLRAEMMVFPTRDDWKWEGETPSMTFESSATIAFFIFFPTQCSSTALRAASTSVISGIDSFLSPNCKTHIR